MLFDSAKPTQQMIPYSYRPFASTPNRNPKPSSTRLSLSLLLARHHRHSFSSSPSLPAAPPRFSWRSVSSVRFPSLDWPQIARSPDPLLRMG